MWLSVSYLLFVHCFVFSFSPSSYSITLLFDIWYCMVIDDMIACCCSWYIYKQLKLWIAASNY
jgi:hypothetical protein